MIHVTKCDITYNKDKCDIYNKNNIFYEYRHIGNIIYEIALTLRMKQIHFMIFNLNYAKFSRIIILYFFVLNRVFQGCIYI